jgi:branched-chain amino acid transport system permease protein
MESQIIINGIAASAVYVLAGLSFQVIYNANGFFHFAHGAMFTIGAYVLYTASVLAGWNVSCAIISVIVACSCIGILMEFGIFRFLKKRRASELILLLASLGLYVILQNLLSLLFGDEVMSIRKGVVKPGIEIFGGRFTEVQGITVLAAILAFILLTLILMYSRLGIAIRAIANDLELSTIVGINSSTVSRWSFAMGSTLAGITGALVAMDVGMTPSMGMRLLMMGVVAVIVGGARSVFGVTLGAVLLGMSQHIGARLIGTQWQDAIAFVILLAFLLFRPEGFMGKKIRTSTV